MVVIHKNWKKITFTGLAPIFTNLPADHEYEWEKIQRRRREGDKLILGGNYRPFKRHYMPMEEMLRTVR